MRILLVLFALFAVSISPAHAWSCISANIRTPAQQIKNYEVIFNGEITNYGTEINEKGREIAFYEYKILKIYKGLWPWENTIKIYFLPQRFTTKEGKVEVVDHWPEYKNKKELVIANLGPNRRLSKGGMCAPNPDEVLEYLESWPVKLKPLLIFFAAIALAIVAILHKKKRPQNPA